MSDIDESTMVIKSWKFIYFHFLGSKLDKFFSTMLMKGTLPKLRSFSYITVVKCRWGRGPLSSELLQSSQLLLPHNDDSFSMIISEPRLISDWCLCCRIFFLSPLKLFSLGHETSSKLLKDISRRHLWNIYIFLLFDLVHNRSTIVNWQ